MLGRCAWRTLEVAHAECWDQMLLYCERSRIIVQTVTIPGDALISRSRSILGSVFLRSQCDVLLSVDSDIYFDPGQAVEMVERCYRGKDVIAGLYLTRSIQSQPAAMLPPHPVTFQPNASPVEAPFVSTGFMATRHSVFAKLAKDLPLCHVGWENGGMKTSFYPFYQPYVIPWPGDENMYLSEDWAFCQRARDAGFKIWLDPTVRLGHLGQVMFTLEDLIRPARSEPVPLTMERDTEGKLKVEIASKVATGELVLAR